MNKKFSCLIVGVLFFGLSENSAAGSVTPTDMERVFDKLSYCERIFKDFDYEKASPKHKEIAVTIYKSDYERLKKVSYEFYDIAKQKFGEDDAMRMMVKGIVENAVGSWDKNLSAKDVQVMVKQCRDMIYK
jgi:hypothetical protein